MLDLNTVTLRKMTAEDLDDILAIEVVSFATPWSKISFINELEKTYGLPLVAMVHEQLVGYIITWFIEDEIHIANIAVHPDFRRQGIGEWMMNEVMKDHPGIAWVGLEVRRSNIEAITLYEKLGFYQVGIRKNYYAQEGEDAVMMMKQLSPVLDAFDQYITGTDKAISI